MITATLLLAVTGQMVSAESSYVLGKRIIMPIHVGDVADTTMTKVKVKVTDNVDAVQAGDKIYVWALPGTHTVEVDVVQVDFTLQIFEWYSEELTFSVTARGPPGPGPGPGPAPPGPDVPEDEFDNLGRKIELWSRDLMKRQEVGRIYVQAAARLETIDPNTSMTINESARWIREQLGELYSSNPGMEDAYAGLRAQVAPTWEKFISADSSKFQVAGIYKAIAAGLGVY